MCIYIPSEGKIGNSAKKLLFKGNIQFRSALCPVMFFGGKGKIIQIERFYLCGWKRNAVIFRWGEWAVSAKAGVCWAHLC